ncbi:ABC transporter permease [Amycolatopsis acidiphila]|uniref:ABC transporter permease n=1 Tax=Amycolatopsis acidiphila TaxID=715473 RepID=A0A558A466_9PSEU|nr:ABC transporter permease [Amycolatopsis acidiphila]TVT19059.1 ABC transporter permease [Amycolatopsis acidiphila]UIJ63697.1 ABC transporter permease [Amycolatopsis acidiphila]GHG67388.1 diguanylate cyclase [Amycolatopsis acidiphila]
MAIVEAGASAVLLKDDSGLGRGWLRHLELVVPLVLLVLVVGACFVWPLVGPVPGPTGGDVLSSNLPAFSPGHLLGTDPNGNDVWSRLLYGGRSSLIVGLSVNALGLVLGGTLGAVSAYAGGVLDAVIMRVLDVLIAFPSLVLTLAVAQSLGPSQTNTILALAFFSVPAFARISRAATLRLREQPFMVAADLCGTRVPRMLFRHIAPNILPQLVTFSMLGMGITIVIEGALSFLGLGIPPPAPSWGNMISQGQQSLSATPMLVVWPCLVLFLTVLAFNLLGETLRSRWSGR